MKVYKRHRKSSGALSGDGSMDPSLFRMDSLVESQIAMLETVNLQVVTSIIPVDTPNPQVDLPVDFTCLPAVLQNPYLWILLIYRSIFSRIYRKISPLYRISLPGEPLLCVICYVLYVVDLSYALLG